jgi:hypothetical protein
VKGLDDPGLQPIGENELYHPSVESTLDQEVLTDFFQALRVVPPDMSLASIRILDSITVIFVAGPKDREQHFRDQVLPRLKAGVNKAEEMVKRFAPTD